MDLEHYKYLLRGIANNMGLPLPKVLSGIDIFLPFLEKMRKEGAVVLIKFDGERGEDDNGPYTALVSGKVLEGDFFRIDTWFLEDALSYIIVNYAQRIWKSVV